MTGLRAFSTVALPDDAFAATYLESTRSQRERLSRELERNMVTFLGGARFTISPEARRGAEETVTSATLAFYDPVEHRLYLREVIPPELAGPDNEDERVWTLAHELGHVLQDGWGVLGREPETLDEALAYKAVIEGDASFTATLVLGARQGRPVGQTVARALIRHHSADDPPVGDGLEAINESVLQFPYEKGERFILELHRAGGLEAVQRALTKPPLRTAQIFDAAGWLAGRDLRLAEPDVPARGSFGAALLGSLVELCAQKSMREKPTARMGLRYALAHYVDDHFYVEGPVVVWRSSWSGLDPKEFDWVPFGLGAVTGCLVDASVGVSGWRMGDDFFTVLGGDAEQRQAVRWREAAPERPAPVP
ncbi:MAG: hypothetical protein JNK82_21005 [Myxococcaceae bacterium]|nr:hypothetical protein [Myxococcaceae bacterium]